MATTLTITYAAESSDRDAEVLITLEQAEWSNYIGVVTKIDGVRYILSSVFGQDTEPVEVDCGLAADGNLNTTVYAYPAYPTLIYTLHASYGTLGERTVEEFEYTETVSFSNEDSASLEYPAQDIISAEIVGDMWDMYGAVASLPEVSVDEDGNVLLSEERYGSVEVTYTVCRHVYELEIEPREDAVGDFFGSFVYALVNENNPVALEIEVPDGAEDAASGSGCGYGDSGSVDDDDEDDPSEPTDSGADVRRTVNMCSGVVENEVIHGK